MGLTSAILTAFTGINSNQASVETIGNNIANINTTGFKASRTLFETQFSRTLSEGTAPSETSGGTNPVQVGYGSAVATIQKSFTQGTNQQTGVVSDLAIDGDGFFIVDTAAGDRSFTRAGAFTLNTANVLTANDGSFVQGFAANADGTIDPGNLTNIEIPVGTASDAAATTQVRMVGNLNAGVDVSSVGSVSVSNALSDASGNPATATTPLANLVGSDGNPVFAQSDVINIAGVQKGGVDVPTSDFVVGVDGTTYGDLAAFLQNALGINSDPTATGAPGVTIGDGTTAPLGTLAIRSDAGEVNAISLDATSISNNTNRATPFAFTTTSAVGQGVTTTFPVFDSLGTPISARLRLRLDSKTDAGLVWRFTAESTDAGAPLGEGTITFDQNGKFLEATGNQISIPRPDSGAVTPLAVTVDFSDMNGLTELGGESVLQAAEIDGFEAGTLTGYEIDGEGIITGVFDNGQDQVFGQVALATFTNNQGLVAQSENRFSLGPNSGEARVGAPLTGSAGRISSRQLELGNVDLSRELVGLITASTGFSAAGRAVRTADDMLQELLLLVR